MSVATEGLKNALIPKSRFFLKKKGLSACSHVLFDIAAFQVVLFSCIFVAAFCQRQDDTVMVIVCASRGTCPLNTYLCVAIKNVLPYRTHQVVHSTTASFTLFLVELMYVGGSRVKDRRILYG